MCYINIGDNMKKIIDSIKDTKKAIEGKIKYNRIKKFSNTEVIFLVILTCVLSLLFGSMLQTKSNEPNEDETLKEFVTTYNDIVDNYYKDIDKEELLSGAVNGMLSTLDEYSTLINSETNENFYLTLEGRYKGVGIEITNDENNNIVIVGVLKNSPAEQIGLKAGDIVKKIDDMDLNNKSFNILSDYIKNNSDREEYAIVVDRNGDMLTYELKKENVIIQSVSSKVIEKNNHKIGYIYVSIFSNTTAAQFKNALSELNDKEIDSLIIDVRENTGGHLTTVVSMLSEMVSSKHIIYQVEKNEKASKFYSLGDKDISYPIVVIQNGNSASASELFAISLKENLNATVIGEKSYGKGTIQELNYLSNGDSYKYTTKKWLSPNGNWINEIGVTPDIEVKLSEEYINDPSDDNDNQLQTAINKLTE